MHILPHVFNYFGMKLKLWRPSLALGTIGLVTIPTAFIIWHTPAFQTEPSEVSFQVSSGPVQDFYKERKICIIYPQAHAPVNKPGCEIQMLHLSCTSTLRGASCLPTIFRFHSSLETEKPIRVKLYFSTCVGFERWFTLNTHLGWMRVFPDSKMAQYYLWPSTKFLWMNYSRGIPWTNTTFKGHSNGPVAVDLVCARRSQRVTPLDV